MADVSGNSVGLTASVGQCANCGHERFDRFCPKCGQNDRDYIRGLPPILGDILKETFEIDSRFFRTLKPLFLRPGELPSEFSRNRRASYISPLRLYIFTSLVFFFLLAATTDFRPPLNAERDGVRAGRLQAEVELESEGDRAASIESLKALLPVPQQRKVDQVLARPGTGPKIVVYSLASVASQMPKEGTADADWLWELARYGLARVVDVAEDPRAAGSAFLDNLPFAMFVTLPAYTLLLMLLYVRHHRYFTEHLIFAVQLHIFAFIIFTVLVALPDQEERPARTLAREAVVANVAASDAQAPRERDRAEADGVVAQGTPPAAPASDSDEDEEAGEDEMDLLGWLKTLLVIWVLVYHYLALRRFYRNGRVKTLFKWSILTVSYMVLLLPGLLLSITLAVTQL